MAYSEFTVLAGGIFHVPVVIGLAKFLDGASAKNYRVAQAQAEAKARAEAEVKAKQEADARLKA